MIEVKRVAEEWKIQNEKEEVAQSEKEVKRLVPERFHKYKYIHIFGKRASERMPIRKL